MHKKQLLAHGLALAASLTCLPASADLLSVCNSAASEINKNTPQQLDKFTTLLSSVCLRDGGSVVLVYRNEVSAPAGALNQTLLNTALRPKMLQAWCTDPVQRRTLNVINIRYTYSESDGKYIGRVDLNRNECR